MARILLDPCCLRQICGVQILLELILTVPYLMECSATTIRSVRTENFGGIKIVIVAFSVEFIPIVAAKLRLDHKLHAANGEF